MRTNIDTYVEYIRHLHICGGMCNENEVKLIEFDFSSSYTWMCQGKEVFFPELWAFTIYLNGNS